jgi:uncharacterized radical SAM superfamily Fe-S cluster-containing enzyme
MMHTAKRTGRRTEHEGSRAKEGQVLPHQTPSLCPDCLAVIQAVLYEEDGRVLMKKHCSAHGTFTELISSDATFYQLQLQRDRSITRPIPHPLAGETRACPQGCGLCAAHRSGPLLLNIDLTNRCNLHCPICFADAGARGGVVEPSLDQVRRLLDQVLSAHASQPLCLQYTGGEPTLHPQFLDMLREAKSRNLMQVQIATNGLCFARDPEFAFQAGEAGLNAAYLQFDALSDAVYERTRGRPLLDVKLAALANLYAAGIRTMLVPTVVRGINDDQVGAITRFAIANSEKLSGISWQPVSFTGRLDHQQRLAQRFTMADLARAMESQTGFVQMYRDWYPFCFVDPFARLIEALDKTPNITMSCHPGCGSATFLIVDSLTNQATPIPAFVDVEPLMETLRSAAGRLQRGRLFSRVGVSYELRKLRRFYHAEKAPADWSFERFADFLLNFADFRKRYVTNQDRIEVSRKARHRAMLMASMHFQDAYNYQLDRVQRCVVQYAAPDGRLYPFCSYNSGPCHRQRVEDQFAVPPDPSPSADGGAASQS